MRIWQSRYNRDPHLQILMWSWAKYNVDQDAVLPFCQILWSVFLTHHQERTLPQNGYMLLNQAHFFYGNALGFWQEQVDEDRHDDDTEGEEQKDAKLEVA